MENWTHGTLHRNRRISDNINTYRITYNISILFRDFFDCAFAGFHRLEVPQHTIQQRQLGCLCRKACDITLSGPTMQGSVEGEAGTGYVKAAVCFVGHLTTFYQLNTSTLYTTSHDRRT
jgi:hypothetical protein